MNDSKAINTNKMGTEPILPLILKMSLPAMFSMLIQALYNIVDSMFIGWYDPTEQALNAINIAYPLQMFMIAFVVGTGVGVNSLIARRLGEGNIRSAENVAMTGLILAFLTWIMFALIGIFATRPFITFMAGSEKTTIIDYGVQYASIVLIFSLGSFIQVMFEKSIQATGNMVFPMISHLIGTISNIILDYVFIFTFDMGIKGAAVATVIGQFIAMAFLIVSVMFKKFAIKFSFKGYKLSFRTIKEIYNVALSGIVMQSIGAVLVSGINMIIKFAPAPADTRTIAQTVYGLYFKIQSFAFMPVFGLNQGISPIIGYNFGAKNRQRMMKTLRYGLLISFAIMLVGLLIFNVFPETILSLFDVSEETVSLGVVALRRISLCFIPASVGIILTALFQAVGKGIRSLLMSVLRQLVLILPIAFFLSKISIDTMWFAFPIAEVGALIVAIIFFIELNKKEFSKLGK